MRGWSVIIVIGVLLAAGCLGLAPSEEETDPPVSEGEDEASQGPPTLAFRECQEQVGAFTLPAQMFQDDLPDGFEPRGLDGDEETALFTVFTWRCQSTQGDGVSGEPVLEMVGTVNVDPPEAYASENASAHVAILHGVTDRSDLADAYEAWGVPIVEGQVEMETEQAPMGTARAGQASSAGPFQTEMSTSVAGPIGSRDAGEARFFGITDATLTAVLDGWWTEVPAMQEGQATLLESHLDATPPTAVPVEGLGYHYWGDGFGFGYEKAAIK